MQQDKTSGPQGRLWSLQTVFVGGAIAAISTGCAGGWAMLSSLDGERALSIGGWEHGSGWVLLGSLLVVAALRARLRAVASVICAVVITSAGIMMYQLPGATLDASPTMFTSELAWGAWLVVAGLVVLGTRVALEWKART